MKKNPTSEPIHPKKAGLYFGSFNPVHVGHLVIANYMTAYTDLDEVWFVVSPQNPHKKKEGLLDGSYRLELVRLAVEGDERLQVSDIEFFMPRPSYTFDTLALLKEHYPGVLFTVLMGSDNLENLHKWKNYESIVNHYSVIVYPRPGFDEAQTTPHKNIVIASGAPLMEISSSFIREGIKKGRDMRHFLPEKCWSFIEKNELYR